MTFWDKCAPIYDIAEKTNRKAYDGMLATLYKLIPENSTVLECASGTGSISIVIAQKAKEITCTDMSQNMLTVAKRKANKKSIQNIRFELADMYCLDFSDKSYDVVIASQVLHLLNEPRKAVDELKRVSNNLIIVPVCLLDGINFFSTIKVTLWKLLGFTPSKSFNETSYKQFLTDLGLTPTQFIVIDGKMPMAIATYQIKKIIT